MHGSTSTICSTPPGFPSFQSHGTQVYHVKMLTKQIRICAGCRLGFDNEHVIPPSPYNMCIAHIEPRQITPKGKKAFTTKSVVHYHANPSCIWINNGYFLPSSIEVPEDVMSQLDQNNKNFLMQYFQKYIS